MTRTGSADFFCECGKPPVLERAGDAFFFVCRTSGCDGEGQICRAATDDEIASAQATDMTAVS
jgi:hypothetical protein